MNSDDLQTTLAELLRSGARSNPAYATLLADYANYHAALVVEGSVFVLLLIGLGVYCWQQYRRAQRFAKLVYCGFGLGSIAVALCMLLLVAANISNAVDPQAGFAQLLPELGAPQAGTQKAALHQAVAAWAQSGSAAVPPLLEEGVRSRLAWQRPKAIACSALLLLLIVLTARVWRSLVRSRVRGAGWSLRAAAQLALGVLAVPVTLVLMVMALANTQASLAPITLTLLFG